MDPNDTPLTLPAATTAAAAELSIVDTSQAGAQREGNAARPDSERQLLAERSRIEENIRRLTSETEGLKQRIAAADGKAIELSAQEQRLRQQETVEVKRARHTISLYANISSIRWDYSNSNVKGWVTSASGGAGAGGAGMRVRDGSQSPHRLPSDQLFWCAIRNARDDFEPLDAWPTSPFPWSSSPNPAALCLLVCVRPRSGI